MLVVLTWHTIQLMRLLFLLLLVVSCRLERPIIEKLINWPLPFPSNNTKLCDVNLFVHMLLLKSGGGSIVNWEVIRRVIGRESLHKWEKSPYIDHRAGMGSLAQ